MIFLLTKSFIMDNIFQPELFSLYLCDDRQHTYHISSQIRYTLNVLIFFKKALLEHVIDDLLILGVLLDFGLKTGMCLNNNIIYSHQYF